MDARILEGIERYLSGEQVGVSTSIADYITYGYGRLDQYGHWEYPVPTYVVEIVGELRRENAQLKEKLNIIKDMTS